MEYGGAAKYSDQKRKMASKIRKISSKCKLENVTPKVYISKLERKRNRKKMQSMLLL